MPNPSLRITIPRNPQELIALIDLIIAKHIADGVSSVLTILNMTDMEAKAVTAKAHDAIAGQANRDKETAFYERDYTLGIAKGQEGGMTDTVLYFLKAARDILLGYYKAKPQKIGDWGYEVDRGGGGIAVIIPENPVKMIALAKLVLAKNTSEGADSLIKGLDIVTFTEKYEYAEEQHLLATKLNRDKEIATTERDRILGIYEGFKLTHEGTLRYYVTQVRDVLLGLNKGHEALLGNWGFEVQYGTTPPSSKISIKGEVFDPSGVPVADATLMLVENGETVMSDDDGKYSFPEQTPGVYNLEVSKDGYESQTIPGLNVIKNKVLIVKIVLNEAGGSLLVSVFSEGQPLPEATVSIESLGLQKQTGPAGTAQFDDISAGTYSVEATAPGKQPMVMPVTIDAGALTAISFDLINE